MLIAITPLAIHIAPSRMDFKEIRKTNYGFAEGCESTSRFLPRSECQSDEHPSLLVWGDSYAMHLVPGLAKEWKEAGVIQATKSSCGPLLGLAPRRISHPGHGPVMNQAWAQSCIAFNQSVIEYLRTATSVTTVVLSSPFSAYVSEENYEQVLQKGQEFVSAPVTAAAARAGLRRTVDEIRSLGIKVVLIAPPPSSDFDIGGCLERQLSGRVAFGGRTACAVDQAEYQAKRAKVLDFLKVVETESDVAIIRFDSYLCHDGVCQTLMDNTMIYRDSGHLSYKGSEILAKRMQLASLIKENAR